MAVIVIVLLRPERQPEPEPIQNAAQEIEQRRRRFPKDSLGARLLEGLFRKVAACALLPNPIL